MTAEDGAKAGARLREMMDANRADRERRQDECGFTACVDRHQAALNAEYEAAQVILTTAPTTMAGVVAVIRYAAELENDSDAANALADMLFKAGLSVWLDRKGIQEGAAFDTQIEEAIAQTRVVIVIWSEHSVKSHSGHFPGAAAESALGAFHNAHTPPP